MQKLFIFLISLCCGQSIYVGSISFDYSGTENGTFQADLSDSTFGGASAASVDGDSTSTLLLSAIQTIDTTTMSVLFIYMQDDDPSFAAGNWSLPPNDLLNPNIIFGFFPEVDTSFFSQFTDLLPDSLDFDSTFIEDLLGSLLSIILDESYLGITGNVSIDHITYPDSLSGSFDVGALQAGIPPGIISISNGTIALTGVVLPQVEVEDEPLIPEKIMLYSAYPNPFNPTTTIRFSLETQYVTSLHIYDINGQLVETLVNSKLMSGEHEVTWNASTQPSGVYFIQLVSGNNVQTEKVLLIK